MDVRELPHTTARVETGVIQFGSQDWPGVFIRGDCSFAYALALRQLLSDPTDVMARMQVEGLVELLESSRVGGPEDGDTQGPTDD